METFVVDTDVVSFGFRQSPIFIEKYGPLLVGNRAVVSFMTVAEIRFGMLNRGWRKPRSEQMDHYIAKHFVRYGVTDRVCEAWSKLIWDAKKQGRVLQTADGWVAATAKALNLRLVTHNAKDFGYLQGLEVVSFES